MSVLTLVSAVIIALIVYTLTMEKLKEIATLKLIGAPDRTIIGLIVQQALMMGVVGFGLGTPWSRWPRTGSPPDRDGVPGDLVGLFFIVICVCILASAVGVRVAVRVDPAKALVG
jgi:ABC-type transport system, involved in lipoprotein release, permease component